MIRLKQESQLNTKEKIAQALRMKGQMRLKDLSIAVGKVNSTITYHLQHMVDNGTVVMDDAKVYRLAEEGEVEKAILKAISAHGPSKTNDLFQLEEEFGALVVKGGKGYAC